MKIEGKWSGTIFYRTKYKKHNGEQLSFELVLEREVSKFHGVSIDTKGLGVHPDPAKIEGEINETSICFVKRYPTLHYIGRNNIVKIEKSRKGPAINFVGSFDESNMRFTGEWYLNTKFYILGLIPWKLKQTGTWAMKKTDNNM